jgi:hypothetical protein
MEKFRFWLDKDACKWPLALNKWHFQGSRMIFRLFLMIWKFQQAFNNHIFGGSANSMRAAAALEAKRR